MSSAQLAPIASCPVNSHNEWDPLEEVIIGNLDAAMFPEWTTVNVATAPPGEWLAAEQRVGGAGSPYPPDLVEAARRDLAGFIHILETEGVTVRRLPRTDF